MRFQWIGQLYRWKKDTEVLNPEEPLMKNITANGVWWHRKKTWSIKTVY